MSQPLNYVDYEFESLVMQLQDRIRLNDSWKDIYRSSTGQTLIEILAYVLNAGLYYTERRAVESYLPLARNLSSVKNLVALLNYQPKRKTSSYGILTFSIASPLTKNVFIPKYTECQSSNGIKYLTNEDSVIGKGQTSVNVNSIQGELFRMEVISNGAASQEYTINSTSVENSSNSLNPTLRILVDSVEWEKVDSFIYSESTSKHYKVINEMDDTVSIQFGDGINGFPPPNGSSIIIEYIKSEGSNGNVSNTGIITTVNSTIYDEDGNIVNVSVTNSSSFLGGDDAEGIEEIRYEAPRVFKTGDRAVSRSDFISILENYAGVSSANVWGENEEAKVAGLSADPTMLNKVKICLVLNNWGLPDQTFENTISDFLYNISMLTVKYEFVDAEIIDVVPRLNLRVSSGYSMSQVQSEVESVISDQFILGNTTKLGTLIKYSRLMNAIDDVDGVSRVNMVLEILKVLEAGYYSGFDYGGKLNCIPVTRGSARLFIDDTCITTDNGSGVFSYTGTFNISGTIDYDTGEVKIDISPEPTSPVYIKYQQYVDSGEGRDISPSLKQICRLYDVDFSNISME